MPETTEKVKMCPFCEGNIAIDATDCTYCGSSLVKTRKAKPIYHNEESLASLYDPPYSPHKRGAAPVSEPEIPTQIYTREEEKFNSREAKEENLDTAENLKEEGLGSLLLLSLGGQLFTLAWVLFFFSHHGRLVLEWKSRYWMVYLAVSLLFLYQGWKKLKKVQV